MVQINGDMLVSVNGLSVEYELPSSSRLMKKEYFRAVNDVDLEIRRGESWTIVGESGSGKSTLAMAMMGLLEVSDGEIEYSFKDAGLKLSKYIGKSRRELRHLWKRSSMVFQDPYSALDSKMLISDVIIEPFIGHRFGTRSEGQSKIKTLVPSVGLKEEHLKFFPDQLSGGLRQRVAIARSLINEPELVIFDEPTSSLDVSVQAQILNLIIDVKERRELTFIFITHNLLVARHMSNKIMVMYLGNVMEKGITEEVFTNPLHPYTKLLISSVPLPKPDYKLEKPPDIKGGMGTGSQPNGCVFHNRCPEATEYCGWTSEEIAETLRSEVYSMFGSEEVTFEIKSSTSLVIHEPDVFKLDRIYMLMQENKAAFRFSAIQKSNDQIAVELQESWKPKMVKHENGREVKCILYDTEFSRS